MTTTIPHLDPKAIRSRLFLSQEKFSVALKVSVKTLARAEKQQQSPTDSEIRSRLIKLDEIANLGQMVYTDEGLIGFLNTPLPIFNGYTAADMIVIGDYDRVISVLAADFEGLGY